jgi:hypothetical protein
MTTLLNIALELMEPDVLSRPKPRRDFVRLSFGLCLELRQFSMIRSEVIAKLRPKKWLVINVDEGTKNFLLHAAHAVGGDPGVKVRDAWRAIKPPCG